MDAINYGTAAMNPLQAFQGALALGAGLQQQQLASAKARAEQEALDLAAKRQEAIQAGFAKLQQPGATPKDYADLAMVLPKDQSEALRESFKMLQTSEQEAALKDTAQVFSAFKAGRPDVAVNLIRAQAQAERASGNEQGAKLAEEWANMAEAGPEGAAAIENLMGYTIAQMPGGDKAIEGALKFEADRRLAAQQPILMAQKAAELAKATSEAEKAAIEAKYAEQVQQLDLQKTAADMGLSNAEAERALAQAKSYGADAAKTLLETEFMRKNGGLSQQQRFQQEDDLRKEYVARTQTFTNMKQTYANIVASSADNSGAGDIALVTGFMKMLDPGSVVRESEFATARDTSGLLAKLQSMAKKVESGQFLSVQQRKDFAELAGRYMKAAEDHEATVRKDLGNAVRSYGLSESNVFGTSTQPANIAELRAFLKKNNPGSETNIDSLTEEQLAATYPKGYAAFRSGGTSQTFQEVDY